MNAAEEPRGRRIVLEVILVNQSGEAVQSGEARVLVPGGGTQR